MVTNRTSVVDGWIWWATFHAGIARHHGVVTSVAIANAARAELHRVPLLSAAPQDRS